MAEFVTKNEIKAITEKHETKKNAPEKTGALASSELHATIWQALLSLLQGNRVWPVRWQAAAR